MPLPKGTDETLLLVTLLPSVYRSKGFKGPFGRGMNGKKYKDYIVIYVANFGDFQTPFLESAAKTIRPRHFILEQCCTQCSIYHIYGLE